MQHWLALNQPMLHNTPEHERIKEEKFNLGFNVYF
jgi:hypothetical protein